MSHFSSYNTQNVHIADKEFFRKPKVLISVDDEAIY